LENDDEDSSGFDSDKNDSDDDKKDESEYNDDIGGLASTPAIAGHSSPDKIEKLLTPTDKPEIEEDKNIVHPLQREIEQLKIII
jgi:hypothetical protein